LYKMSLICIIILYKTNKDEKEKKWKIN